MARFRGGKPNAIGGRCIALISEYENDLVVNVDGEAAEHGASHRRQSGKSIENEFVRNGVSGFEDEYRVIHNSLPALVDPFV